MKEGKTLTFIELVKEASFIQIPIIQRDYAQGRKDEVEVRRNFLDSIKVALLEEDLKQPLDLDFVYGSFEGVDNLNFSVLDGQQRLTTLFLLHWYFAVKDSCLHAFQELFVTGGVSKFTYRTRVSATEFFNALAAADDVELDGTSSLSEQLIDKQWFFLSWKSDPTVQACLTMLDAMHQNFHECDIVLYAKLVEKKSPCVVFQYLNLESFGLSDELYIKMNARGKPLSDFENFKAWFCGQLENSSLAKRIENQIDQEWTDLFWQISRKHNISFDKLYLRFFNLMAFYSACEQAVGGFDSLDQQWKAWLRRLRISSSYIPTDHFTKFNSFGGACLKRIDAVLNYFSHHIQDKSVLNMLVGAITSSDYVGQIKFYSFILFIQEVDEWDEDVSVQFLRWMRVTSNLINNHRIDELSPFLASIRRVRKLLKHRKDLYEFLSAEGMESGFTNDQRGEEVLKAQLIVNDHRWEQLLIKYEKHLYLQGKLDFILDMSTVENVHDMDRFDEIASKVADLLDDEMLRSPEFLVQRAMLAFGDYLINESGSRYSFVLPIRSTYRDRSENWFRVVKGSIFKNLVNSLSNDVAGSLKKIISDQECGGWRKLIVDHPEVIRYCGERRVKKENGTVYLLSKSTYRGYHAELRTFVFNQILSKMDKEGVLPAELTNFRYVDVYGSDVEAYVQITLNKEDVYNLYYDSDGFSVYSNGDEPSLLVMPKAIGQLLHRVFPEETINTNS